MPAVTVRHHCPAPHHRARPGRRARAAGQVGDHRAERLRGRGLPGPPRLRRRRPAPSSTRSSTWTRWARSSTRRASRRARRGTRTAASRPSPTSSTAIFEHQDSQRRRRPDHQRRHPVDDRRQRAPAHRDPAGGPRVSGGLFHGIQLWVNLPRRRSGRRRATRTSAAARWRCSATPDGGALLRVIAGDVAGHRGPGCTHTPITLVHATLAPGRRARLPWRPDFNALVYVLAGSGHGRHRAAPGPHGQLAVFGAGDATSRSAADASPGRRSRTSTSSSWAASRSASRSPATARS